MSYAFVMLLSLLCFCYAFVNVFRHVFGFFARHFAWHRPVWFGDVAC